MITTRGKFEPKVLSDLDNRSKLYVYEPFALNYTLEGKYKPDLVLSSGVIVELKGKFTPEDRRKMIAVKQAHPDKDIRIVFQKLKATVVGATRRKDGTKLTCEQWARSSGFLYAEGTVPESWFDMEPIEEESEPYREQGAE